MPLEIDPDSFNEDEILEALEGRQKIHVSRKAIVKALKASTSTVSILLQDAIEKDTQINMLTESNRALLNITRQLQKQFRDLQETVHEQGIMLQEHDELIGSGRIEELFVKVESLEHGVETLTKAHNEGMTELRSKNEELRNDLERSTQLINQRIEAHKEYTSTLGEQTNKIETRLDSLGCKTKEGHFRVRADKVAYGETMVPLPRVMQSIQSDFNDATELLETQLQEHQDKLDEHDPKVKLVPKCLEVASDNKKMLKALGVGDGEGENLLEQLQSIKSGVVQNSAALLEKADAAKITEVIEMKYDEIVEHLQLAISAATDDEDEFKRVAGELRGMVKDLMLNKSDRVEVMRLKEMLVADNTMREDMAHIKIAFGEKMDRKEVLQLMANAADKSDIMSHLSQMVRRLEVRIAKKLEGLRTADDDDGFGNGHNQSGSRGGGVQGRALLVNENNSPHKAAMKQRSHSQAKGPRLGPGGPSLGGGFQVCLPTAKGNDQKKSTLPQLRR
eukprot:g3338.t1